MMLYPRTVLCKGLAAPPALHGPHAPAPPGGRVKGGSRRWGVIECPELFDIMVGVPPLPIPILPRVDQPTFFEPFQGGGANPHLVGRFSDAHMSSPDASLPRPFRVIHDHSRPPAARRRAPAATWRPGHAPSCL